MGNALWVVCLLVWTQDRVEPGLAAGYPEDQGIETHPAVLFHDAFETGEPGSRWDNVRVRVRGQTNEPAMVLERNPAIARGTASVRATLRRGIYEDISLSKGLVPSRDEVFMRYYIRHGTDFGYISHGGGGFKAGTPGSAGVRPAGDRAFWATFEPNGRVAQRAGGGPPGGFIFYAYWHQMQPSPGGRYWGNWFEPSPVQIPPLETWVCVEWRVRANTPNQPDGEMDCWINGVRRGSFRGINWRTVETLKIDTVFLMLYLPEDGYERNGGGTTRTVWYDDVVVATSYIGPKRSLRAQARQGGSIFPSLARSEARVLFSESFDKGPGRFSGGEWVVDGSGGPGALGISPPFGVELDKPFRAKLRESSVLRFQLKPLQDVEWVSVIAWVTDLGESVSYRIQGLKTGTWNRIEIKASDLRVGRRSDTPSAVGHHLDHVRIAFEGEEGVKVLLDDFEVRE